ncbi:TPM domain-containing protein [Macellibacteroides fermentans]|uniref:TPM domain-containing protein n=1 Tax=Macellibacteroides fermentans TaxID=879969 RepID=A0A8E1ZTN7_9PORP|nr:TPM domain-containing protein [Macellibacteroides fermentans]NYI48244.1 uncharacterized protein [Macellibacteroides fermentans]
MLLNKIKFTSRRVAGLLVLFLAISSFYSSVQAASYTVETVPNAHLSDRSNRVSNPDGIILPEDVATINQMLQLVEDSLSIEVAVVAIESIGDNDARMFATDLFKHWGIGKKGEDNGLLILLVTDPAQRAVVFETGYGIEGILPDAICYRLQQNYMIPDLKAGNFSQGMAKGVAAVGEYLLSGDYQRSTDYQPEGQSDDIGVLIGTIFLFMIMIVGMSYFMKRRPRLCPRCGKKTLVYQGTRTVQAATYQSSGLAEEIYVCKNCSHTDKRDVILSRLTRSKGPIIGGGIGGFGGGIGGGFSGGGGSWGGGSSGGGGSISRF